MILSLYVWEMKNWNAYAADEFDMFKKINSIRIFLQTQSKYT